MPWAERFPIYQVPDSNFAISTQHEGIAFLVIFPNSHRASDQPRWRESRCFGAITLLAEGRGGGRPIGAAQRLTSTRSTQESMIAIKIDSNIPATKR